MTDLAFAYGTPLYVYSRQAIEDNWRAFDKAFGDHPHLICYAVKANSNLAVLSILVKLGSGFDVLSIGELQRVLAAGGDANSCIFSGVGKSFEEIKFALEVGILCFNVESKSELLRIQKIATSLSMTAKISIRVNPNVDAKTHPYISTGLKNHKFGIDIDEVLAIYLEADRLENLDIIGIDCHIGSQIRESKPFLDALDKLLKLVETLKTHGITIKHLDLGGGFGIDYEDDGEKLDLENHISEVLKMAGETMIIIEPGRAVVGDAGVLMTKIEYLKQNPHKSFAIVDAAMNDLLRPALYDGYHLVKKVDNNENKHGILATWDVVGPVCESSDFLAKKRKLCLIEGEYLAVMTAGAYSFAMSSNYNSRPRAAEVLVENNTHNLIRDRETTKDLFKNEHIIDD